MYYIIRIKAVSECMRIRRAALCYVKEENSSYDISKLPHPLKKFKNIKIEDSMIEILGKREALSLGKEVYFYITNPVDTGNGIEIERITLGAMLMPLDKEMEEYYLEQIKQNITFDQWNGEYEYFLGLMYELDQKDEESAKEWYNRALEKKFPYSLLQNGLIS